MKIRNITTGYVTVRGEEVCCACTACTDPMQGFIDEEKCAAMREDRECPIRDEFLYLFEYSDNSLCISIGRDKKDALENLETDSAISVPIDKHIVRSSKIDMSEVGTFELPPEENEEVRYVALLDDDVDPRTGKPKHISDILEEAYSKDDIIYLLEGRLVNGWGADVIHLYEVKGDVWAKIDFTIRISVDVEESADEPNWKIPEKGGD